MRRSEVGRGEQVGTPSPNIPETKKIDSEIKGTGRELASSVDGRIKEVLVSFGPITRRGLFASADISWRHEKMSGTDYGSMSLIMIKNLVQTLPDGVKLKVVARSNVNHDGNESLLAEFYSALQSVGIDNNRVELEIIPNRHQDITKSWMRDRFLLSADNKKMFVPYLQDEKNEYSKFLSELAVSLGLEIIHCPFYFEGGDIKVIADKMYLGTKTVVDNLKDRRADDQTTEYQKLLKEFSDFFGMEVVVVGQQNFSSKLEHATYASELTFPPLFHLDLYYTPLGNNDKGQPLVAIGDVSLFYKIIKEQGDDWVEQLHNSFEAVKARKKQESIGFDSNKINVKALESGIRNATGPEMKGDFDQFLQKDGRRMIRSASLIRRISLYLDQVADEARQRGFEVVRLPLMPQIADAPFSINLGDTALITYNNSLVEDFTDKGEHKKRVWLPNYGRTWKSKKDPDGKRKSTDLLDIVDREAERILRGVGCIVQNVDFGVEHTVDDGSLHCRLLEFRE
ncbi:MAG: hypothetical protein Q7S24_00360 [bacterium]|nr:hypothetical protein [bacterium]